MLNSHEHEICSGHKMNSSNCWYCESGNFRESFIFANSDLRHICDNKKSRIGHDLPILVNERVISPFCEDFIFKKLRICGVLQKKTLAKISAFAVFYIYDQIK